jgi:hypothetical protein
VTDAAAELARFVRGELDPAAFPHREHVRVGFEMPRCYDFAAAAYHCSCGLRAMAARAGRPEAFHQTTTIACLSLIAERLALCAAPADFAAFELANPDLMDKSVLAHWYQPERLALAAARRTFLLPERAQ